MTIFIFSKSILHSNIDKQTVFHRISILFLRPFSIQTEQFIQFSVSSLWDVTLAHWASWSLASAQPPGGRAQPRPEPESENNRGSSFYLNQDGEPELVGNLS